MLVKRVLLFCFYLCSALSFADSAAPYQRVLAIHQSAIENMLRLQLQQQLVAVAFIDDEIPAELNTRLHGINNIAKTLPTREQVMTLQPDLIYAGFASAFTSTALGCEKSWQQRGINTRLNAFNQQPANRKISWDDAWAELFQLADLFNVTESAIELKLAAKARLKKLNLTVKPKILLLDAYSLQANVAGCCGGADLLIRLAGGVNVSAALNGRWSSISWEVVAQYDPDVIIITTYQRGKSGLIREKLQQHRLLANINAVKHRRIIELPFTETIGSPRIIDGIEKLQNALQEWF